MTKFAASMGGNELQIGESATKAAIAELMNLIVVQYDRNNWLPFSVVQLVTALGTSARMDDQVLQFTRCVHGLRLLTPLASFVVCLQENYGHNVGSAIFFESAGLHG